MIRLSFDTDIGESQMAALVGFIAYMRDHCYINCIGLASLQSAFLPSVVLIWNGGILYHIYLGLHVCSWVDYILETFRYKCYDCGERPIAILTALI